MPKKKVQTQVSLYCLPSAGHSLTHHQVVNLTYSSLKLNMVISHLGHHIYPCYSGRHARAKMLALFAIRRWLDEGKVSCILCHRGVPADTGLQLGKACCLSWEEGACCYFFCFFT